jgi:hypothetical protein
MPGEPWRWLWGEGWSILPTEEPYPPPSIESMFDEPLERGGMDGTDGMTCGTL